MKKKGDAKTGGRTAGTPNQVSTDLRATIKDLLGNNVEQIKNDFASLKPSERVAAYERLLQYVIPKQKEIETVIKDERNKIIQRLFGKE